MPSARRLCVEVTQQCPVELTTYGYYPNAGASYFFIIVFGVCCIAQLGLGFRYKTYPFMIAAVLGTFGEAVGYGGRLIMHGNPWSPSGFKTQICCLVLAPSFLAACIYLSLKHIVRHSGSQYSRVQPKHYTWWFIGGDFGSIVIQAIGGGVAAAGEDNRSVADVGNKLIITGIALQLVVMTFAAALIGEFYWRRKNDRPIAKTIETISPALSTSHSDEEKTADESAPVQPASRSSRTPKDERNFKLFCWSMGAAFVAVYVRCVYRIPEMSGGWGGPLMRKEVEFYILDGMMCAIASLAFTIFHPAFFFPVMKRGFEW